MERIHLALNRITNSGICTVVPGHLSNDGRVAGFRVRGSSTRSSNPPRWCRCPSEWGLKRKGTFWSVNLNLANRCNLASYLWNWSPSRCGTNGGGCQLLRFLNIQNCQMFDPNILQYYAFSNKIIRKAPTGHSSDAKLRSVY